MLTDQQKQAYKAMRKRGASEQEIDSQLAQWGTSREKIVQEAQQAKLKAMPAPLPEGHSWNELPFNIPSSAIKMVEGLTTAVIHPEDTLSAVKSLGIGAALHAKGVDPSKLNEEDLKAYQLASLMGDDLKQKYGSWEGIKNYAITDPLGALGDLSTFAGGFGLAAKGASVASKSAKLAQMANVLSKVSNVTNPMNAVTKPLGYVARAAAPALAESAIGVKASDRLYGKRPGQALLEETTSIYPEKVSEQAQQKIQQLEADLVKKGTGKVVDYGPTQALAKAFADYAGEGINTPLALKLKNMYESLTQAPRNFFGRASYPQGASSQLVTHQIPAAPGATIPSYALRPGTTALPTQISPTQDVIDALRLKREFADRFTSKAAWENLGGDEQAINKAKQIYGSAAEAVNAAVPGGAELNQRISSLIPVANRAAKTAMGPGVVEGAIGTATAKTGALAAALAASKISGPVGFVTALFGKEILTSPSARLLAARTLKMPSKVPPTVENIAKYATLQMSRSGSYQMGQE